MKLHYGERTKIDGLGLNYICVASCVYSGFGAGRLDIKWNKTGHTKKVTCKRCLKVMINKGIIGTELYCKLWNKKGNHGNGSN